MTESDWLDFAAPPAGSTGTLSRNATGIVISFSPKGVFRTYSSHLAFSVILASVGFSLLLMAKNQFSTPGNRLIYTVVFTAGLYLLATTIYAGCTSTIIAAGKHGLTVENNCSFFSFRRSWTRSQIGGITLHGYRVAAVTVGGKEIRLPLDRGRSDVQWLAATVRQVLGMPPQLSVRPEPPINSRLVCEMIGATTKVTAPSECASLALFILALSFLMAMPTWRALYPRPGDDMGVILTVIVLVFVGFVVTLLLLRNRMRSPTIFEITASELVVTKPYFFGQRRYRWPRGQIEDTTANSNEQGVFIWQKAASSRVVRIMLGGSAKESFWIASVIRHVMNLLTDAHSQSL